MEDILILDGIRCALLLFHDDMIKMARKILDGVRCALLLLLLLLLFHDDRIKKARNALHNSGWDLLCAVVVVL